MSAPAVHVVPIFATPFGVVTLPEAVTLNIAVEPTLTVWPAGGTVISGAVKMIKLAANVAGGIGRAGAGELVTVTTTA